MNHNVSLFFSGDFCSKPSPSLINVDPELKSLISSCDYSVVNFEVPLRPLVKLPDQSRERFFQNDETPGFLMKLGFTLFSIANNHAFDWDDAGYLKTKAALGDNAFGAGTYDEAYKVKIVEKKGVKIGFMALSFAAYKGVFNDVCEHDGLGCAYINDLKVNHVIIEAKKQVDYLFILPHDGIEYIDVPLPETIARYRDFVDYGADGVFASHPHCPQGWEEYKGKPIFYSLGNFFFNSKPTTGFHCTKPHWYEGRCVVLKIVDGSMSWEVINTLNVDNKQIVIDSSESSKNHNIQICRYLKVDALYKDYLLSHIEKDYQQMLNRIDTTFHQNDVKVLMKIFIKCLKMKFLRKTDGAVFKLKYMFNNDLNRYIMLRMINRNE